MFEDNHGVPRIGNLFEDFDMSSLPDAINGPTQTRLNRFLRDDLKLAITAPELTVRGIVAEMMKFKVIGSLCWDIFEQSSHSEAKTLSLVETTSAQVELRRVASQCAASVLTIVEEADEERREGGKEGDIKTLRSRAKAKVEESRGYCLGWVICSCWAAFGDGGDAEGCPCTKRSDDTCTASTPCRFGRAAGRHAEVDLFA